MKTYEIILGDCVAEMSKMPENSVDSIVTDPPYGIRFMGKAWDGADIEARAERRRGFDSHSPDAGPNGGHKSLAAEAGKYDLAPAAMRAFQEFSEEWASEAFRILKPGGHLLSFASARTYHRMTCGIEDAGFEIRDQILWIYGSGFPKSHNLSGEWEGWGTALKPAHDPICVARKPLIGTVAANVLVHGTGALNIDGCRVGDEVTRTIGSAKQGTTAFGDFGGMEPRDNPPGRWPANLIHDGSDEVLAAFPDAKWQQGDLKETGRDRPSSGRFGDMAPPHAHAARIESETSAARFFYCAKTSKADRNEGTAHLPQKKGGMVSNTSGQHMTRRDEGYEAPLTGNNHPTVKPTDLMAYLCRLVTPPGGVVLDPFMGSGSTGKACMREGFRFIGIELDADYLDIASARIAYELTLPKQASLL